MASSLCASRASAQKSRVLAKSCLQRLDAGHVETRPSPQCSSTFSIVGSRPPGKMSVTMNLMNLAMLHRHRHAALDDLLYVQPRDRVQQHHTVVGQGVVGELEEVVVAVEAEVLQRFDGDDAVHRLVELAPVAQQDPVRAVRVDLIEQLLAVGVLVFGQGQADDVDVVLLDGALHRRTPAAADVEQGHPRLAAPACPASGRAWRPAPRAESCPRAGSTRSCRSESDPRTARRTRSKGRSALGRCRRSAACSWRPLSCQTYVPPAVTGTFTRWPCPGPYTGPRASCVFAVA